MGPGVKRACVLELYYQTEGGLKVSRLLQGTLLLTPVKDHAVGEVSIIGGFYFILEFKVNCVEVMCQQILKN